MDILLLNEVSVLSLPLSDCWLPHNGLHLKSITRCLISFSLTAHPRLLHKIQAQNGSSLLAKETRVTSGTSAHLLMQLHNVTSRLFTEIYKTTKNFTNSSFCALQIYLIILIDILHVLLVEYLFVWVKLETKLEIVMSNLNTQGSFLPEIQFGCIIVKVTSMSWLSVLWLEQWLTWP